MKRGYVLLLAVSLCLALATVFFLPGCSGGNVAPAKEPIKLGLLTSYTGVFADSGPLQEEGVKFKLDEANNQVAGRPIKLIIEDDASDPAVGLEKMKKLVTLDKIDAFIGPVSSPVAAGIAAYIGQSKLPGVALMNKPFEVAKMGAFILPYGALYQDGTPLGWYLWDKLGYKTITTIGADMNNGRQFVAGAVDAFKQRGGTIVQQQWPKPNEIDFGPYLTSMQKADASISWLGSPVSVQFIKQYNDFGIKVPHLFISGDNNLRSFELKALGNVALGLKGSMQYSPLLDNPANKKFVAAFQAKYNKLPDRNQHSSYVATEIMLLGIEATGGDTAYDKLYPAMLKLKFDDAMGPVSFESNGLGVVSKYIAEVKVVNGDYLWSPIFEYKDVKYIGPQ